MVSVIMLNVVMLSVATLNVVMQSVVTPLLILGVMSVLDTSNSGK